MVAIRLFYLWSTKSFSTPMVRLYRKTTLKGHFKNHYKKMKFIDCKNNLESVFFKLMNLPEGDRCSILNSKSIHGWSELYEVNQYRDIEKAKHKKWLRLGYELIQTRSFSRWRSSSIYSTLGSY